VLKRPAIFETGKLTVRAAAFQFLQSQAEKSRADCDAVGMVSRTETFPKFLNVAKKYLQMVRLGLLLARYLPCAESSWRRRRS
jgi:hypothetical protein